MDFEISSTNLLSFRKALEAVGKRDELFARVAPDVRAALEEPHTARWHPGRIGVETWEAAVALGGPGFLEELNYKLTRDSFGPLVGPMVRIALTLSGSSPATVFARMGDAVSLALRGVRYDWEPRPPNAGTVTLSYPRPMPLDVVEYGWRGIFRAGGEMAGKTVKLDSFAPELANQRFRFQVSW